MKGMMKMEEKKNKVYVSSAAFSEGAKQRIRAILNKQDQAVHEVWHCKILQHHKGLYMILGSNKYWEVTFNGDANEYYVDQYIKELNEATPNYGV